MKRLLVATVLVLLYAAPSLAQTCAPGESRGAVSADGTIRVLTVQGTSGTGTGAGTLNKAVADLKAQGWQPIGNPASNTAQLWCAVSATTPPPPPPAPVDCVVSAFSNWQPASEWGACTDSVQTRTETRTRTIITQPANGGLACPLLSETRTVTQACTVTPPPPPPSTDAALLFSNGWDLQRELGCNANTLNLLDNRSWNDYGGSGACSGTVHDADIVSDVTADGGFALRVNQKSGNQNGTDFRIVKTLGSQTEITSTFKVRYSDSWRWANGDHKIVIFTDAQATAQNVYINWRGGTSSSRGRVAVHVIPSDVVLTDRSIEAQPGRWYKFRVHLVAGTSGKVEVWLTECGTNGSDDSCNAQPERKLTLTTEVGSQANPDRLNTGQIGAIKPDTTYNAGSSIPASGYQQWYDSIKVWRGLASGR